MAFLIGQLIGSTVATILFGALTSWLLRKLTKIELVPSYFLGVVVITFVSSALYVYGSGGYVPVQQGLLMYGLGSPLAFGFLYVASRKKPAENWQKKNGQ
jgi:hypothetical protein